MKMIIIAIAVAVGIMVCFGGAFVLHQAEENVKHNKQCNAQWPGSFYQGGFCVSNNLIIRGKAQ